MRKQKVAKTFTHPVRDSWGLYFACEILHFFHRFCGFRRIYNRSNCGGGFVFVRIFGINARLMVCGVPKILTSAKDAPKDKLQNQRHFLPNDSPLKSASIAYNSISKVSIIRQ